MLFKRLQDFRSFAGVFFCRLKDFDNHLIFVLAAVVSELVLPNFDVEIGEGFLETGEHYVVILFKYRCADKVEENRSDRHAP